MRRGRRADARSPRGRCSRRRAKPSRSHVQARQSSRRCLATASPRQPAPGYKPRADTHTHMCARAFNGPLSGTTRMLKQETESGSSISRAICKSAMQVCTSLQTDNHASTSPLSFLQAGCPSCRPTNIVKALKAVSG